MRLQTGIMIQEEGTTIDHRKSTIGLPRRASRLAFRRPDCATKHHTFTWTTDHPPYGLMNNERGRHSAPVCGGPLS